MYYNEEMCYCIFDYLKYFFDLIFFNFSNNFNRCSHTNAYAYIFFT